MQDSHCPIGRHELLDHEWRHLAKARVEWARLELVWQKAQPPAPENDARGPEDL